MKALFIALIAAGVFVPPASAQSTITRAKSDHLIETYRAYIGRDDLYNSGGARLREPWQIIRQDRANFYVYGGRDRGDEADTFFADKRNRETLEAMLASGSISPSAASMIVQGNIWINVSIYGDGNIGDRLDVTVSD
ncbi:hypothetical protein PH547_15825 [Rhizobium sp. CNPSo 3464]|uniref:hypothetical protein n=1 Tax=Rhizobium sp. CNPSo 3464 TaxID=3021406 RepID=UPI00254D055B|nr:hypothetical protein [Rhizobium sp. CNPSo 3464]MDK4740351.1 hypothetical protein [Rhizobium sp. CNPSo 3464]